jgi:NADH-quinone oxidoreductase subunit J
MSAAFVILAGLLLASSLAAVLFRRLVHTALGLALALASLAGLYLQLGAEFIGFAQVLVYVGAVAILIVFVLLLTKNTGDAPEQPLAGGSWLTGVAIAGLIFGCLAVSITTSSISIGKTPAVSAPEVSTRQIGEKLMSVYVVPLEAVGLLLTAAAIGAAVIALGDKDKESS